MLLLDTLVTVWERYLRNLWIMIVGSGQNLATLLSWRYMYGLMGIVNEGIVKYICKVLKEFVRKEISFTEKFESNIMLVY